MAVELRPLTRIHHDGGEALLDDRRTLDAVPLAERVAVVDGGLDEAPVEPGGPPQAQRLRERAAGRRLRDVTGTLAELLAMAGTTGDDYLRVGVKVDGPVPGVAEQVREVLPNALDVRLLYERVQPAPVAVTQGLGPGELFVEFYTRRNGAPPPPDMAKLFHDTYDEAARG